MTCRGRSVPVWKLVLSCLYAAVTTCLLLALIYRLKVKHLSEMSSSNVRMNEGSFKVHYTRLILFILVGLAVERSSRIVQSIVLYYGYDLAQRIIISIVNLIYSSLVSMCSYIGITRLKSTFERSAYVLSESYVRSLYIGIIVVPILVLSWTLIQDLSGRSQTGSLLGLACFLMAVVLTVMILLSINFSFVSRLSKLSASSQINHMESTVRSSHQSGHPSASNKKRTKQTGSSSASASPENSDDVSSEDEDFSEDSNHHHNHHSNQHDQVLKSGSMMTTTMDDGNFQRKGFRQSTISKFNDSSQRMLGVAAKQSLLFACLSVSIAVGGLGGAIVTFDGCFSSFVLFAEFLFTVSNGAIGVCQYLSLSDNNEDYRWCCYRCDLWCRKTVAFHTEGVMDSVLSQRRNTAME